ncbi:MAG: hypothetical protein U9O54_04260 [Chloroflexota bacterium]|nr:hypothetical protein [Chloroflexota bacterium]
MKSKTFLLLLVAALFVMPGIASAQEDDPTLSLRLNRNFGYGGLGKIQGRFTLEVEAAENLSRVEFFVDGDLMGVVEQAPFDYQFHTENYSSERHVFSAIGYTSDNLVLRSNQISKIILSSEDAWAETQQMIVPILVLVGGLTLLGLVVPFLLGRKKDFKIGEYGLAGGAVCPRCELPFSRHLLSPNLLVGKLARCPHCGKWSIVPRASGKRLEEAEARFRSADSPLPVESPSEESLKRMLEESRFEE